MNVEIAGQRLEKQAIGQPRYREAAEVVKWLGAVQAQEYGPAKWALGLRMREGVTDTDVEGALNEGRILRTHVMRPTWHFVTPADIRWMLELSAPHVHRTMATYNRQMELPSATLTRATGLFERALGDRGVMTRSELGACLQRAGLEAKGPRLAHMTLHAELEAVICSGPRRGKQSTYALLAERAPMARRMPRDEAIAELTRRYVVSHGPATIRDLVWWSGLSTPDAKRGLEMNEARRQVIDDVVYWTIGRRSRRNTTRGRVHLLPIYDEYLVSYRDRQAVPHAELMVKAGFSTFQHALVIDGQVAGTWKVNRTARGAQIDVLPIRPLTRAERDALDEEVARYGRFQQVPATWRTD